MNDQPRAVALNLTGYDVPLTLKLLRAVGLPALADQIEAQTKPPRIPEPGPWGVVEASLEPSSERLAFVRTAAQGDVDWLCTDGDLWDWDDLIDPVLVREGVES